MRHLVHYQCCLFIVALATATINSGSTRNSTYIETNVSSNLITIAIEYSLTSSQLVHSTDSQCRYIINPLSPANIDYAASGARKSSSGHIRFGISAVAKEEEEQAWILG